uniref:Uncharacterized protein n=1 Tax=Haptolina ericina TaxID=156174 RepID=A0A7S3F9H1_9EUKA
MEKQVKAKDILNSVLRAALPSLRLAISDQIAMLYEQGQQMPGKNGFSVEPLVNPARPLVPHEVLKQIRVHVDHVACSETTAKSFVEQVKAMVHDGESVVNTLTKEERAAIKLGTAVKGFMVRKTMREQRQAIEDLKRGAAEARREMAATPKQEDQSLSYFTSLEDAIEESMKRGGLARTASGGLDSSNLIKAAESAVSDMTNVHEFRADVHLAIRLEFGESQPILFKIRSNRWFMKEVTIRVLWLEVYAPAHLVFDLYYGKLNVSFSSPPTMRWDIELQLGWLSLPDWIEDWLPARIVEALLGRYTAESPLVLNFDPRKLMHKMIANGKRNRRNEKFVTALEAGKLPHGFIARLGAASKQGDTGAIDVPNVVENQYLISRLADLKEELAMARRDVEKAYERGVARGYDLGHTAGFAALAKRGGTDKAVAASSSQRA